MIEARDLIVSLGRRVVLRGVSVEVPAGKVTVVIGPNGSGKSTLLKALAGELPFSGDIRLHGRSLKIWRVAELAQIRAVMPQAGALAFPFTVREVVRMGALAGAGQGSSGFARDLPELALRRVGLDGFGPRLFSELSGGEQQRVHLARVLAQAWEPFGPDGPRFLLLDEPASNLDIRHQMGIMSLARDYATRGGGVLMVVHELGHVARFADQVIALHNGKVARAGPTEFVIEPKLLSGIFGWPLRIAEVLGSPVIVPVAGTAATVGWPT
ncbi:MAG TPA: heme ABC transporter ATP-binding protein [Mesorhizobium sp.]|jgi:iron complex transport system ATP-binding protein|nr:heme ABC transporter ATP-binding protein [Mesorhizobium sp.]